MVVALAGTNQFALVTGKGDGYFNTPVYISAGGEPTGICAADFNGDSKTDVAVTTAAQAKQQPDGTAVTLSGAIVSRVWTGSSWVCYVQDPDRSGGIRVEGGGNVPAAGAPSAPGALGGIGTNTGGLLVRLAGCVTRSESGEVFFYLDDGSSLDDGSGYTGVRCIAAGLVKPSTPGFAIVTGVSGVTDVNGQPVRCIRVQRQEDIVQVW